MKAVSTPWLLLIFLIILAASNLVHSEDCIPPLEIDCNSKCQVATTTTQQCSYVPRDCYSECRNLQSYPTFEKEACIDQCVAEDRKSRDAWLDCIEQKSRPTYTTDQACLNSCTAENEQSKTDYANCLAQKTKLANLSSTNALLVQTQNKEIISSAATALESAAQRLFEKTGKRLIVTSASRTPEKQAELFYKNCLKKKNKAGRYICSTLTCNPAKGSGIISGSSKKGFALQGDLAGVTDEQTIISALIENGDSDNCPHTTGVAADAWCEGGQGWVNDPQCQATLTQIMDEEGFCRLDKEGWHFEFNSARKSSGCQSYTDASYTLEKDSGTQTIDPTEDGKCTKWNYRLNKCTETTSPKPASGTATIQKTSGNIEIAHADGTLASSTAQTISAGDTILTKNGNAVVAFEDGSSVQIGPNSEFIFRSMDTQTGILDLIKGKIKMTIQKLFGEGTRRFEVSTPNAVMAVRGTEFVLEYENSRSTLYLYEGEADIIPWKDDSEEATEAQTFEAGQTIVIEDSGIWDVSSLSEQQWASQTVISENITTPTEPNNQTPQGPTNPQTPSFPCPIFLLVLFTVLLSVHAHLKKH